MERGARMNLQFVVALVVALFTMTVITCPKVVEGAFGIILNPCTRQACADACKKILGDKYRSSACYGGNKFCLCLG
ncbi:hypothetical protein CDL12_11981 [Handroanthus impetiginosus]|uniref:Knottin scorpion toxin-like domain-containing protein n=1 Tax=Handroanthus impetiginosus TaxID=429701 RepID=A0A2G9HCW9_9LAMI|nr:hypothetical protein CDL12_11981 [Handroanthus impetiginosus]